MRTFRSSGAVFRSGRADVRQLRLAFRTNLAVRISVAVLQRGFIPRMWGAEPRLREFGRVLLARKRFDVSPADFSPSTSGGACDGTGSPRPILRSSGVSYQPPYPATSFAHGRLVMDAMRSGICISWFQASLHASRISS